MNYVIDIDDTICIPGPTDETKYTDATPIPDRIAKINKLYDEGNRILYLTARGMGKYKNSSDLAHIEHYEFTRAQLVSWGCKFHDLSTGTKGRFIKPPYDLVIDDKAKRIEEL